MKPKIAFCFSWQARTLSRTYTFFQKNLFDAAKEQEFDYDVFCAVENDEDVDKVNLLNPTKVKKIKSSEVEKIIEKKYWDFIRNEFPIKYFHSWTERSTVNMLQQYYKVWESMKIKMEYEKDNNLKYDIAFKLRFDAPFPNKLNFIEIHKKIKENENSVICNKHKKSIVTKVIWAESIDDIYFIMSNPASNKLSLVFDNWIEILKWEEIKKHLKIHKIFNRYFSWTEKQLSTFRKWLKSDRLKIFFNVLLDCPIIFLYTKFFKRQDWERWFYNCFYKWGTNITTTHISIWIIKNSKRASVTWKFKKSIYEL